jgi:tRNA dimethylallyltransferase
VSKSTPSQKLNDGINEGEADQLPHVLFIVGPTATGKSDFAVRVIEEAKDFKPAAEIINCDSVQFFDVLEIGAAKPGPDLLSRAVHHLIGHVQLGGSYTAGDFRRDALGVIDERGRLGVDRFVAVGGSGFYVQALEKGMYAVPPISVLVKNELEIDRINLGEAELYLELGRRDPESALKIKPADSYRIMRALEILRSTPSGETLTQIRARFEKQRPPTPFNVSKIGLRCSRDFLRQRITLRTELMLKAGLIDEVENLRTQGFKDWAPLASVGYREVQQFLDGAISRVNLNDAIITSTMQLAKRQMTWFKRDPEIHWFSVEENLDDATLYAKTLIAPAK